MLDKISFEPQARHEQHPDLHGRKQLAARLLIARNLGVFARDLPPATLVRVHAAAGDPKRLKDGKLALDAFLMRVFDTARRICDEDGEVALGDEPPLAKVTTRLARFEEELSAINCQNCVRQRLNGAAALDESAVRNAICGDNHSLNSANMGGEALCWRLLTDMFDDLVRLAEKAYAPLLRNNAHRRLQVRFHTEVTSKRSLSASTRFPRDKDRADARMSVVNLVLPVEHFNHRHYLTIPYYLFHEICVHGPESWLTAGPRGTTNERCPFREGFVDAAAVWLLTHALHRGEIASAQQYPEYFVHATKQGHVARATIEPEVEISSASEDVALSDAARARAAGLMLFDRLEFHEVFGSTAELVKVALALNLLPLTSDQRREVMVELEREGMSAAEEWPSRADHKDKPDANPSGAWRDRLRQAAVDGQLDRLAELVSLRIACSEF